MFIELKNITEEQPKLYEEVLIVNKDKNDFNKAAYMLWNEGTDDECYNWYDEHDQGYEFEEWSFWGRPTLHSRRMGYPKS